MTKSKNENEFLNGILFNLISNSNPRALKILSLIKQRSTNKGSIRIDALCKLLNINIDEFSELLENEGIKFKITSNSQKIRGDKIMFLAKNIERVQGEILSHKIFDKSLRELIVSSDSLLTIIDGDLEFIRLSKLCKILNIGIQHTCKLFELENINLKNDPNTKVSCDLLKLLILNESEIGFPESKLNTLIGKDALTIANFGISIKQKIVDLSNKVQSTENKNSTKSIVLNQFIRNELIRQYTKYRANGICELCNKPAPFSDLYGVPFLETHHVVFLSKGGSDTIDNTVALCPNCHRKIHNLNLESDVQILLNKLEKHKNINL